jgi:16S rRNA U516 pseudouridylate synthase RsuA-like enzyme
VAIEGKTVRSGADKYPTDVTIEIDGDVVSAIPLLALYHKPVGVHSTMRDNWSRLSLEVS